jgi:hypothetical protein
MSYVKHHISHVHTSHDTRHTPYCEIHLLHVFAIAAHDGHEEFEESAAYCNNLHRIAIRTLRMAAAGQTASKRAIKSPRRCQSTCPAWRTLPPQGGSNAEPAFRYILPYLEQGMCGTCPGSGCSKACCSVTVSPAAAVTRWPHERGTARLTELRCNNYTVGARGGAPATVTRPSSTSRTSTSSIGMDMT